MNNPILIIGAGPAGIEAAATLSKLEYQVTLLEKESKTNTNLRNKMLLFPDFSKAEPLVNNIDNKLFENTINLHFNTEIVRLEQKEKGWIATDQNKQTYQADAVLITTGYTPFDATRKEEYGYGIYNGVITSLDLEEMFKKNNITNAFGEIPKKVCFLQCVGSRDEKSGNNYCSKICCITAVKQAIELKKLSPETEVYIFYMDLRMWGQGYEELYREAQEQYGIYFIRGRISEAAATFDGKVQIKSEDTLMGLPLRMTPDLLVLMIGMEPSKSTKRLAKQCKCEEEYGFFKTLNPISADQKTDKKGLFVAGACKRPMSIPDVLSDARAAAVEIDEYLKNMLN
ncbi:MAG: FAD-dependent oxidoreductase [Bacteroidetes bacterium]|nr:FAD-dependent oxidoreductase [Bacteroidota bacterium]MCL1968026.1 FAD-dependent oxidoreductase [Bacteroidota bacterium]